MPAWESDGASHFLFPEFAPLEVPWEARAVDLFEFLRYTVAWTATIALLWPLNVPLAALAYKVRNGAKPIDMPPSEFWTRSTFAALGLLVFAVAMVGLDYYLAFEAEFPPGPVHAIAFTAFLPVAAWYFFVLFALEDMGEGLGAAMLYLYLPMLVLLPLHGLFGVWGFMLNFVLGWLKTTVT
jgi:hypothetical protein